MVHRVAVAGYAGRAICITAQGTRGSREMKKHKLGTRQQVVRLPALPQEMCIIGFLGPSNICKDIKREHSSQKNEN